MKFRKITLIAVEIIKGGGARLRDADITGGYFNNLVEKL